MFIPKDLHRIATAIPIRPNPMILMVLPDNRKALLSFLA